MNSVYTSRCFILSFLSGTAISLIGAFLWGPLYFVLFEKIVKSQLPLRENEDGSYSKITFYWQTFPADSTYNFYMFNITNPDEVMYQNAMPRLVEKGPYSYNEWEFKQDIEFRDNGNQLHYRNNKSWAYDRDASCAFCEYDDIYMLPNAAFMAVGGMMYKGNQTSGVNAFIFDLVCILTGEQPLRMVPMAGILFESYNDPLIDLINSELATLVTDKNGKIFGLKIPKIPAMGYFPRFNHTVDEDYLAYTGKDDVTKAGIVIRWAGNTTLNWWSGDYARELQCGDGSFNKPDLKKSSSLTIFQSFACRVFHAHYVEDGNVDGIPTMKFKLDNDDYETTLEKLKGYRYENYEKKQMLPFKYSFSDYFPMWPCGVNHTYRYSTECSTIDCGLYQNWCSSCCNGTHYKDETVFLPPGMVPLRCQPGRTLALPFAAMLSPPHFAWSPPEVAGLMVGLSPDKTKHDPSEFNVHGLSGASIQGMFRMQIAVPIYNDRMLTYMHNIQNAIIPSAWVQLDIKMKSFALSFMKLVMVTLPRVILGVGLTLFLLPPFVLLVFLLLRYQRRRSNALPVKIEENNWK